MRAMARLLSRLIEFHEGYFDEQNTFLMGLLSFLVLLCLMISIFSIPFTIYLGIPWYTDFILFLAMTIPYLFGWGMYFSKKIFK